MLYKGGKCFNQMVELNALSPGAGELYILGGQPVKGNA